jgi:hypothetical protein
MIKLLLLLLCTQLVDAKPRIFAPKYVLLNETHPESSIRKTLGKLKITRGLYLPDLTRNKPMWMLYYEGPTKCNYVRLPKVHLKYGKQLFECEDFAVKEWEIPKDICETRLILNPGKMDKMRIDFSLIMIAIFYLVYKIPNEYNSKSEERIKN